jgi:hypothetical protein
MHAILILNSKTLSNLIYLLIHLPIDVVLREKKNFAKTTVLIIIII